MRLYACLLLTLVITASVVAQEHAEVIIPEPSAGETNNPTAETEQAAIFDRNELMTYPKSVLVNLCISLQARVAELEAITQGTVDVPALQERISELENEIEALKQSNVTLPPVHVRSGISGATGGEPSTPAGDKPEDKTKQQGIAYRYVIQYRSHYEYGGVYETRTRSARHLRDRIKVLLRITNTSDTTKHIKYYIEACKTRDGLKVIMRSGQFSAALKPGEFQEPTCELFGDDIAIATDMIRLADMEIVEVETK